MELHAPFFCSFCLRWMSLPPKKKVVMKTKYLLRTAVFSHSKKGFVFFVGFQSPSHLILITSCSMQSAGSHSAHSSGQAFRSGHPSSLPNHPQDAAGSGGCGGPGSPDSAERAEQLQPRSAPAWPCDPSRSLTYLSLSPERGMALAHSYPCCCCCCCCMGPSELRVSVLLNKLGMPEAQDTPRTSVHVGNIYLALSPSADRSPPLATVPPPRGSG